MNYEFCDGVTYTIKKGDTLYEISRKYRVPLALLLRANPYIDVFNLQVGDTICVPANPGQMPQCPKNRKMRPIEMEKQPEAAVQQPAAISQSEDVQRMENSMRTMMEQPFVNLQRKENDNIRDCDDADYDDGKEEDKEEYTKVWEKYIVQPGDTLADVMAEMKGSIEEFIDKNDLSCIYMLPGVAYYIYK